MTVFDRLVQIVARLRGPEGCPWDRQQTPQSLTPHLIEESYELAESLESHDSGSVCEELGDLLLQIVLHAQMASERGDFALEDVVEGLIEKLIHRHPHVFGTVQVSGSEEVLDNWERLKRQEHSERGQPRKSVLDGIPRSLPALQRAEKMQRRAAKVGFDWSEPSGARAKLKEETEELDVAIRSGNREALFHEAGDVLASAVNLCRLLGVDAEQALRAANRRFEQRFRHIEEVASAAGRSLHEMTLPEMDEIWEEAKALDQGPGLEARAIDELEDDED
ncbi:MAG: nucleoside triphosphate pyrophosphohydrolase [candidate division WS1 bacterium]|nr:nucleoside triphosphate pyrophosphohydrolase [candidate division WS1 bacterium]